MKKLIIGFASVLVLTGCGGIKEGEYYSDKRSSVSLVKVEEGGEVDLYVDEKTGCHYLYTRSSNGESAVGGFTPYYGTDGKVMGCGDLE